MSATCHRNASDDVLDVQARRCDVTARGVAVSSDGRDVPADVYYALMSRLRCPSRGRCGLRRSR
eukprot:1732380-Karenia_brevis.AAC.1